MDDDDDDGARLRKGEVGAVERGENNSLGGGDLKKEKLREERSGSLRLERMNVGEETEGRWARKLRWPVPLSSATSRSRSTGARR